LGQDPKLYEKMRERYWKNWERDPAIQAKAIANFDKKIEQGREDVVFFVFEQKDNLAAFLGAEKVGPGKIHIFGINVNPAIEGAKVAYDLKEASARFFNEGGDNLEDDQIMKLFGENNDFELECDPTDPKSTSVYISKDGYVAVGTNFDFGGRMLLKAIKEKSSPEYYFRGKSETTVIVYHNRKNPNNTFNEGDKLIVLKFKPGSEEMKKMFEKLLDQEHYRITQYFFNQYKDEEEIYCAFEKST
jgi:hypothetical protein